MRRTLRALVMAIAAAAAAGSAAAEIRTGTVTGTVTEGSSASDSQTHAGSIVTFHYSYDSDDAVFLSDYGYSFAQVDLTADIDGRAFALADLHDANPIADVSYFTGGSLDRTQVITSEFAMAFNDEGVLGLMVDSVPPGDDPPIDIYSALAGHIAVTCNRGAPLSAYACVTPGAPWQFGSDFVINEYPGAYGNQYLGQWTGSMNFVSYAGPPSNPGAVPEPGVWSLMILGFASAGLMLRRRKPVRRVLQQAH